MTLIWQRPTRPLRLRLWHQMTPRQVSASRRRKVSWLTLPPRLLRQTNGSVPLTKL